MGFVWILFGVVLIYTQKASSTSPYVSTISNGYTMAELGSPGFTCYSSDSSTCITMKTGRYTSTYLTDEPADDPPPPMIRKDTGIILPSSESLVYYQTKLITSSYMSYGVFYCSSRSPGGERTVVPTIFLNSNANFVPTNGRFSKTVSKGDVDVLIEFTEVNPSPLEKEWMFNGTVELAGSSLTSTNYTIRGEVERSNAGVYEIYIGGERGQARAGLFRLIIRACPSGRYNTSSGCTQSCQWWCYNGGICHDETGICICPPGFKGKNCEKACGGNRYGRDCENRCHYGGNKNDCIGLQFCVPDPYGCSCAPGFKGLDCMTECGPGEFGASCTEACHCTGECNRFTGVCAGGSTECQAGWIGFNCQVRSGFSSPLLVSGVTNDSVTLLWGAWNNSGDSAIHPLKKYLVFYRPVESNTVQNNIIKTDLVPSKRVTGLSPDTDYLFSVVGDLGRLGGSSVAVLKVRGRTMCSRTCTDVPPPSEIQYMTGSSFIVVKWNAPNDTCNTIIGYNISYARVQPSTTERHSGFIVTRQAIYNTYIIEGVREGETYELQMKTVTGDGSGVWTERTLVKILSGRGFSLRTLLLCSIIPSALAFSCLIAISCAIAISRKKRTSPTCPKDEENKRKHCSSSRPSTEEHYEAVDLHDDTHEYTELQVKSQVQPDKTYMNFE